MALNESIPLTRNGGIYVNVFNPADVKLRELALGAPSYFSRAARHVAYEMHRELKIGIMRGNFNAYGLGINIPERNANVTPKIKSMIRKNIRTGKVQTKEQKNLAKYLLRPGRKRMTIRNSTLLGDTQRVSSKNGLASAIGYRKITGGAMFGWLSSSAAAYGAAVQGGKWGRAPNFSKSGPQPVTPKMRNLFYAVGFPLRKETTRLYRPKVDIVEAYTRGRWNFMMKKMSARINRNISKGVFKGTSRRA